MCNRFKTYDIALLDENLNMWIASNIYHFIQPIPPYLIFSDPAYTYLKNQATSNVTLQTFTECLIPE